MCRIAVAWLALMLAWPSLAAELRVPLPGRDDLVFDLPPGWRGEARSPRPDVPPTIGFTSGPAGTLLMLVTPIWPHAGTPPPTPGAIRDLVEGSARQARPRAVEPTLALTELASPGKTGFYFFATDREPEPNGYKYMTQGAVGFGDLLVSFTLLVNGEPQEPQKRALELVRSMRRAAPGR